MGLTEDILNTIDIVDIVSRHVQLKKMGNNYTGLCPFHNEKTPSFSVSQTKQIFKCFGCGMGGNAIKFFMEIEKLDFGDAIKELAEIARIDLTKYKKPGSRTQAWSTHELMAEILPWEKEKLKLMNSITQNFFTQELTKNTIAINYLHQKRHLDDHHIQLFGLGYAPDSHFALIQILKAKGFNDEDIVQSGLGKKNAQGELYAFFRNRITFPIRDTQGNTVGFGARAINPEDNPKYLNSSDSALYEKSKIVYGLRDAKSHIKEHNQLIIVEGYMDVIGLARVGYPIGIATCGTSLTMQHMKLCKRFTSNISCLFDNDKAWQEALGRALKIAYQQGLFPTVLVLPEGFKDIDEVANEANSKELVEQMLAGKLDGFLAYLQHMKHTHRLTDPVEKNIVLNKLFDILMHVENYNILDHYLQLLAQETKTTYELLLQQFKGYSRQQAGVMRRTKEQDKKPSIVHQPDLTTMIGTLLVDQNLTLLLGDYPHTSTLTTFFHDLINSLPDHPLKWLLHDERDEASSQELSTGFLWREQLLQPLSEPNKRAQLILKIVWPEINNLLKQSQKQGSGSLEEKLALGKRLQELNKLTMQS